MEDSEAEGYGDMYGVEVALLTRRFTLEPKDNNNLIGGHTIIFHTPHVAQNIKGVEFRRFGQQGNIGRYPLHFRKCEDSGSRHRSRFAVSYLLAYSRIISLSNRLIRYERVRLWQCSLQESREGFEPTLLRHTRNSQRNSLRECRIRYIWPLLPDGRVSARFCCCYWGIIHHIRLTTMSHSYFELLVEVNGTIGSSGTWVLRLRGQQQ